MSYTKKIKVVTYGQMLDLLQRMIESGVRDRDEAFTVNGAHIEDVSDGRSGEMLVKGSLEVEVKVPPLRL